MLRRSERRIRARRRFRPWLAGPTPLPRPCQSRSRPSASTPISPAGPDISRSHILWSSRTGRWRRSTRCHPQRLALVKMGAASGLAASVSATRKRPGSVSHGDLLGCWLARCRGPGSDGIGASAWMLRVVRLDGHQGLGGPGTRTGRGPRAMGSSHHPGCVESLAERNSKEQK